MGCVAQLDAPAVLPRLRLGWPPPLRLPPLQGQGRRRQRRLRPLLQGCQQPRRLPRVCWGRRQALQGGCLRLRRGWPRRRRLGWTASPGWRPPSAPRPARRQAASARLRRLERRRRRRCRWGQRPPGWLLLKRVRWRQPAAAPPADLHPHPCLHKCTSLKQDQQPTANSQADGHSRANRQASTPVLPCSPVTRHMAGSYSGVQPKDRGKAMTARRGGGAGRTHEAAEAADVGRHLGVGHQGG